MIKISGTNGVETAKVRRPARRTGAGGETFQVDMGGSARASGPPTAANPLSAVDALLTLQAVPAGTEEKRKAVRRADDMLDVLDEIRISLLEGKMPSQKLQGLLRLVQSQRSLTPDPRLNAVLEEIEIRAQVELAKFGALARR